MKGIEAEYVRAPRRNDLGAALLEFGLVMVVFFVFLFGVMDFGRALYTYHFVSNAACEATRYAIVRGADSSNPVTASEVTDYVKGITPLGIDPNDLTVNTTWSPNNAPGSSVKVEVSDNFQVIMPMFKKYNMTLTGASQMVISH